MKKLINDVDAVIPEFLAGLVALGPDLTLLAGSTTVVRADIRTQIGNGLVALISGGGSGHEPAHGGYVGEGMLTAAVAGEVFTSPSTDAVLDAIRAVAGPAGVLLIVKNYTGDRLNFGLAAEIAHTEGIDVEMVVVADDVALAAGGDHAGRRGLAGTVFVHKIAGAAAAAGLDLAEVTRLAAAAAAQVDTMGVALTACVVPASGQPSFVLAENEMEWGLGIHGEPGVEKALLVPADDIVARILTTIIDDLGLAVGDEVAVLVNNLGATAAMDLSIVAGSALRFLGLKGIVVQRAWSGTFLTALEMAGCSISLLRLDEENLALLDAPARTAAWPADYLGRLGRAEPLPVPRVAADEAAHSGPRLEGLSLLAQVLTAVSDTLIDSEAELTDLDQIVGDGDLGISLARGARAVIEDLHTYPTQESPAAVLEAVSATVRRVVGGTSGPLYAVFLLRAASALAEAVAVPAIEADAVGASAAPLSAAWAEAFTAGVRGITDVGGARLGDSTMVDALLPAALAFADAIASGVSEADALSLAVTAAESGTAATAKIAPRLGRASYSADRAVGHVDPGAHAVVLWLAAIRDELDARGESAAAAVAVAE